MNIVDFAHARKIFDDGTLNDWGLTTLNNVHTLLKDKPHGDTDRWLSALNKLPKITADRIQLNSDAVTAISTATKKQDDIKATLLELSPWRKGPFNLHDVFIDSEWRSNLKWDRLAAHISPLKNRRILDIGCGNGYFLWRMLGEDARCAIGIDPGRLLPVQFQAVRHFVGSDLAATVLPLGIEHIPYLPIFDTVFSMGVIYHRRDPLEHIQQLRSLLSPDGELVLETLIIESDQEEALRPEDRYTQMRNVWHVPSPPLLLRWLKECGFRQVKIANITATTTDEQRATEWMRFQSLDDFLDKNDKSLTIEGYPAPVRAIVIAS